MVARLDHSTAAAEQNASSPPLNCPRCDSTNTKFCYYNNYSLAQPRHFCKSCKRYWTRGGTLRNVPVGGGCRKNKRSKKSAHRSAATATATAASASQSLPLPPPVIHSPAADLNSFLYGFPPIINSSSTLFFPKFELDASLPCYEQNLVNLADLHKTAPLDFLGDYSLFNSRIVTSSSPMATTERYHQPLLSYDHDDLNITTENNALNRSINWQALKENSLDGTNSFAALSGGSGGAVAQSQYIYWNQGMSGSWPESGSSVAPLI